ncbi:MAG: transposase [Gammaproteobacteria bacterium]|nr:transposase [Gammaproteobacteria bacterium]
MSYRVITLNALPLRTMPRRSRNYIPGYPYHIVQRGNNRTRCFRNDNDCLYYLALWERMAQRYGLAVHAYCLMTNHIHFLATPQQVDSISRTTKDVGSNYARYFNKNYDRTGTLWEGRHKSSLIQADPYLISCYRYIELNPVRANLVRSPIQYAWSSYPANALGTPSWITPHSVFLELGSSSQERCGRYHRLLEQSLPKKELDTIRHAINCCVPTGRPEYIKRLERKFGISFGNSSRGRPKLVKK